MALLALFGVGLAVPALVALFAIAPPPMAAETSAMAVVLLLRPVAVFVHLVVMLLHPVVVSLRPAVVSLRPVPMFLQPATLEKSHPPVQPRL